MAELVDAQVSGTCGSFPVKVQVLFRAPIKKILAKCEVFFIVKIEKSDNNRNTNLISMSIYLKFYNYGHKKEKISSS